MKRLSLSVALLIAAVAVRAEPPRVDALRSDITVLAGDAMEGRGLGTEGLERAADWIEARLQALGLEPAFGARSYRQTFRIKTGVELAPGNQLAGVAADDWTPLPFSSSGSFAGELVFAGYGIEAPPLGFRELGDARFDGKVVLMLRYEPQERDEASPFDGRRPSRWSALRYRVFQARERGAEAVIFVTGPLQDEGEDKLPALQNDGPQSAAGLPVLQVRASVARRWLAPAKIDLEAYQKAIDRDLRAPGPIATGLELEGQVALAATFGQADNVAGVIPGRGSLAGETIVLGAHYDHLGLGGQGSMRPNERAVHNGADDNASGVVAVLHAARALKERLAGLDSSRTLVVALFAGEELGLAGSLQFVAKPPRPIADTVAMINLDMVGRLRADKLVALGAGSAPEWQAVLERAAAGPKLELVLGGDGYGPSDQTAFYAEKVPVVHLFTGSHEQYHTPEDDPETVDVAGLARVVELTAALAAELASGAVTPRYAGAQAEPAMAGDSRGYGAYLGTIPDYSAMDAVEGGVLLADVRPGGPADRAGVRGGDRIVEMAGTRVASLQDMAYALQDNKPGTTIDVVVLRAGERLTLRATLGDRKAMATSPAAAHGPAAAAASPAAPPPAQPAAPLAAAPAHAATSPAPAEGAPEPSFYADRPGAAFVVGAGQPFAAATRFPGEEHLSEIRQLTFGGENAEAYFSPDGRQLIFQATPPGKEGAGPPESACDQQYVMDLQSGAVRRVSSGKGRTTCGYFDWPEADRIVYSSTEAGGAACPAPPDRSQGYVWALYPDYDIYEALPDGREARRLTTTPGYDAEATWCHRGGSLVFTSVRDGDLELYRMDEAGEVARLTHAPGYDGGAFYSPDCREIVWRASRPQGKELDDYRKLLEQGLVRPGQLEIFVMAADGSSPRQLTRNGAANFCPCFHPDGERIIFSSNLGSETAREFDLWLVSKQGGEAQRVTTAPGFDGFPHFSPDGSLLVWASNRAAPEGRDTNLFIARWRD